MPQIDDYEEINRAELLTTMNRKITLLTWALVVETVFILAIASYLRGWW